MADNQDRIDVNQEHERRDWARKLGITEDRLREVVRAAGDSSQAVQEYLRAEASRQSAEGPHRVEHAGSGNSLGGGGSNDRARGDPAARR